MSLYAVEPSGDASWPSSDRPVCLLVDASGSLEQRLVGEWIERTRPEGGDFLSVSLPASRRRRRGHSLAGLQRVLDRGEDLQLVPVRVIWLGPSRRRRRVPRLLDLLTLGDPRDPNRLLQQLIVRFRPDRVRVVVGEAASVGELKGRWVEDRVQRPDAPTGFAEYVALQGALTLEVAERRIRGNRYKVPRFVAEDLLHSASFQAGVADLSRRIDQDEEGIHEQASRYLREIAATPSTFVIDLVAALTRLVYTMGYERRIRYDRDQLDRIATLGQQHPVAFLPSHKSNMDHLALTYLLYENGMPPNLTAGGINMNFFPVGPLLRRHGIFFIRRSFKDDEVYKFVLKQYIDYLLAKRFPLEWYLEGGRSRSGKLRAPRFGMLSYVADSWRRGASDDVVLIPTSIAYDQIQDVGAHAAEQRGERKEKESFSWMVRVLSSLRRRYGRIHVSFGEPIRLSEMMERHPSSEPDPEAFSLDVAKLAFEALVRINRVTPITPISLVTLALLGTGDRALTVSETLDVLQDFLWFVERRDLPVTQRLELDDLEEVEAALEALVDHRVVAKVEGGTETVYSVGPDQHLAAAFYRNTIVHFFTTGAIAELALAAADGAEDAPATFWAEVGELRDLLKFEFFFAEKDEFRDEISEELGFHEPDWSRHLDAGDAGSVLQSFSPYASHWVLRPIFEAYLLVADTLVTFDPRQAIEEEALITATLSLGAQYRAQRRIHSPEAVSTVLFGSAIQLATNRGLLTPGDDDVLERRRAFAAEMHRVVDRIGVVEDLAT